MEHQLPKCPFNIKLIAGISVIGGFGFTSAYQVQGLPPPQDTPEEVLQTVIITEGRSSIDDKPLTAAEYAELQARLQSTEAVKPDIAPQIQTKITLLRFRKLIRSIIPFFP